MSLAPGEQRTLAEIGSQLGRSDPQLVAMFARFSVADTPRPPVRRRLPRCPPRRGGRTRLIVLIAVSVALLVASMAVAMVTASRAVSTRGEVGRGASPVGPYLPGG